MLRQEHALPLLLCIASLPRATFYYHLNRLDSPDKYAVIRVETKEIFEEHRGRYGYRRICMELANRGHTVNHKVVMRLMKEEKLVCRVRMRKYSSYKGDVGEAAPNLLSRNFEAAAPNQKWVTDITEFSVYGQKLYLSVILDLHSQDIVSYTLSDRPVLTMITDMLEKALAMLPVHATPILHSDQGWHYRHRQYQRMLCACGVPQSMSRKGNCLDNAVMENFFGHLKSELLYLQVFESFAHFREELVQYIDYYNHRRIKAKLNGLPPAIHRHRALLVS